MTATVGYAELQVTTNYSFLRGASHPEELFAAAALLGLPALGIVGVRHKAGAGFTFSRMDHEHYAA